LITPAFSTLIAQGNAMPHTFFWPDLNDKRKGSGGILSFKSAEYLALGWVERLALVGVYFVWGLVSAHSFAPEGGAFL
jgi:hypothetical protein